MKKQLLFSIVVLAVLLAGTTAVVFYGKGYRVFFDSGKPGFSETGLLVTTSQPNGAQVFINGHLTTATDNTINLSPGTYKIKIVKQGYFSWEKTIKVEKEIVAKADALLFPNAPKLESITDNGVINPVVDPSGSRLAFTVASSSARDNGIYILDMSTKPILTLQSSSKHVADDTFGFFSKSNLSWSPDGQKLLATISAHLGQGATYLIDSNQFNPAPQDVTETLISIKSAWDKDKASKEKALVDGLKPKLNQLMKENFSVLFWSPDETKILYSASKSATLPTVITPRLLGVDATAEQRSIEKDSVYVYDIKEDKNYKIDIVNPEQIIKSVKWFPDSKHLIYVSQNQIHILEFDGANDTTVYAGPFIDSYVFPWPDGSKIVILTNLNNPQISPNLYTIGLK